MSSALIGYSGFVGSTLLRQRSFDALYRANNVHEIAGRAFDLLLCAGAPAQKWLANREPERDLQAIERLIEQLSSVRAERVVLISTVDVFTAALEVTEDSPVDEAGLQPYGLHRRKLESFVQSHFEKHTIVRLPGLVGPGLKKNVVFDFLNENNLAGIDARAIFQFYPMVNLWFDLELALEAELRLLHLTAEPIAVSELSEAAFGRPFVQELPQKAPRYDMRSKHAALFGGRGGYQYAKRDTIQAVRAYAQSEPRSVAASPAK
jgi:hypothetical protein